jgi:hypothetical protein
MIEQRYARSPWFPAWKRGFTWYELCRERENMTAPNRAVYLACIPEQDQSKNYLKNKVFRSNLLTINQMSVTAVAAQ